ncbi:MAG: bifunctional glutamate N-acetyltransferase/amino-acid acetyltransferase ArgJ [Thermoguttaceae bacterium]
MAKDQKYFIPKGFNFAAMYTGIKQDKSRADMTFIASDVPASAAGVFTQNLVCAAPVVLDRSLVPSDKIQAIVVNSGNANACTGERGLNDARQMAAWAAQAVGAAEDGALVMSTGIIGHFLPMDVIGAGIRKISKKLKNDEKSLVAAAKGIMTTDTHHKLFSKQITLGDGTVVTIAGMAKGAGMIAPNMATFLGIVLTDAVLDGKSAQKLLKKIVHTTFNCITVDGHTSTNDTLLLLANGAAGGENVAKNKDFADTLESICADLARSIPEDGEGASHLVTLNVKGLKTEADARQIARYVAESPLTKCALYGNDPNWGRIMSSAGYSNVPFDVKKATLHINGFLVFANGAPTDFDAAEVSKSMASNREIVIDLKFGEGRQGCRFWTCDLTTEYVHINADYHT